MNEELKWFALFGLMLCTILTRNFFIIFQNNITQNPRVQHILKAAPSCALIAIIAPSIVLPSIHASNNQWLTPQLLATLATILCFIIQKNPLTALIIGMSIFFVGRYYM